MAPEHSIILSPLDQTMPRAYIPTALVFATKNYELAISHLQAGLEKTCTQLPWLKGRIIERANERKQLAIRWDVTAPTPVIEEKDAPEGFPGFAQLVKTGGPAEYFQYGMFPSSCLARNQEVEEPGAPVFGTSCVRIEGGLVFCASMHHAVMDGSGYGDFVRLWAENTRGSLGSSMAPDPEEPLNRGGRLADAIGPPSKRDELTIESLLKEHREYKLRSSETHPPTSSSPSPEAIPPGTSKIFTFSVPKLRAVKTSFPPHLIEDSFVTVNNVLCAILWSHVSSIRCSRPEHPEPASDSLFGFAVNGRRILGLNEPTAPFLGNVTLLAQADAHMEELKAVSVEDPTALAPVIYSIACAALLVDKAYIESLVQLASLLPDLSGMEPGWDAINGPDFNVTSWVYMGLYDCDFGDAVGKPELVRLPCLPVDGLAMILPKRMNSIGEETLEVMVVLRTDDMDRLSESETWRSWLAEEK
ncbi:hypothetical protein BU26DRAFT_520923 [Trematosphaeria pertusa]|uniref:Trichothecene 3-O-acetyltransferas-like protein n=1 Tax=Trematosphaeria pertusa TaxID=390896 RepID=A0A6A6I933_9PLEO|nr:uncharacterized protein BU26DRAFT_520923 [Trematosphaeria pertusa]KAF2246452.1 hypothetical protein BU26DRAFT_520923 [Trematosphaeria pertusa]